MNDRLCKVYLLGTCTLAFSFCWKCDLVLYTVCDVTWYAYRVDKIGLIAFSAAGKALL